MCIWFTHKRADPQKLSITCLFISILPEILGHEFCSILIQTLFSCPIAVFNVGQIKACFCFGSNKVLSQTLGIQILTSVSQERWKLPQGHQDFYNLIIQPLEPYLLFAWSSKRSHASHKYKYQQLATLAQNGNSYPGPAKKYCDSGVSRNVYLWAHLHQQMPAFECRLCRWETQNLAQEVFWLPFVNQVV